MSELEAAYLTRYDVALAIGVIGFIIMITLLAVIAVNSFKS